MKGLSNARNREILPLLRKLKKDTHWLLNFILESKEKPLASAVNTNMTAGELLDKCSEQLKAKILHELKGIEKHYEFEGYPPDFQSIPYPEIIGLPTEELVDYLIKLGLTTSEARIIEFLLAHHSSTASEISHHTGIRRLDTYNCISTLLAKALVFSTFDRPQKYYSLPINEIIDLLKQASMNESKTITDLKIDYQKLVDAMINESMLQEPSKRESYQIVMGKNSIEGKIKKMITEAKKQVLLIVDARVLTDMFHSEILDLLAKLGSRGIDVSLRTPSDMAEEFIRASSADSLAQSKDKQSLISVSKICPISINLVIVDQGGVLLVFKSYRGPGNSPNESSGMWTNARDLVAFCKYLFETLP